MIPNTQRMREVLEWCKNNPDKYDQTVYFTHKQKKCFGGAALMIYLVSEPTYKAVGNIFNITAEDARYKLTDKRLTLNDIENNIKEFEKMVPNDVPTYKEFCTEFIKLVRSNEYQPEESLKITLEKFWPGQHQELGVDYLSIKMAKLALDWNPPSRKKVIEISSVTWNLLKETHSLFGFKSIDQIEQFLFKIQKHDLQKARKSAVMFWCHELSKDTSAWHDSLNSYAKDTILKLV